VKDVFNMDESPDSDEDFAKFIDKFKHEAELIGLTAAKATAYVQERLLEHRQCKQKQLEMVTKLREAELREKESALREKEKLREAELREKEAALKERENALKAQQLVQDKELKEAKLAKQAELIALETRKLEQAEKLAVQKREDKDKERKVLSRPKLPYFDEKHDDIESYLFRFEKHAKMMAWPKSEWCSVLATLLKGRALTYFHELPMTDTLSYEALSSHLLKRFLCTEEGFRSKFRSAKPEASENMPTFFARMKRYFSRWIDLASVDKDFEKLVDLCLKEQFLNSCSGSLVTFLKEAKFASVSDMVEAAERYKDAHPMQDMSKHDGADSVFTNFSSVQYSRGRDGGYRGRGFRQGAGTGRGQYASGGGDVPRTSDGQVSAGGPVGADLSRQRGMNKSQPRGRGRGKCFVCGDPSHYQFQCPRRHVPGGVNSGSAQSQHVGSEQTPKHGNLCMSLAGVSASGPLPACFDTCHGSVNGFDALVMLDSGSEIAGVRRSLVSEAQMLEQTQTCKQFLGSESNAPLAKVHLDCEFFSGDVVACVIDNPACDFILGKVPGANFKCTKITSSVQTRAQKAKETKPFRPLLTAKVPQLDVNQERLIQLQKDDCSLVPLFQKVGLDATVDSNGNVVSFVMRDGLLFRRHFSSKTKVLTWQVVVPECLRDSVLIAAHDGLFGGHMAANSTFKRVFPFFFWQGYRQAVKKYCRSCSICQKTEPKGRVKPVPLERVPVIDVPFSRICIDLIGPLNPTSARGHRYVLTCVDVATRYPHAVPLKSITSEAVAEALVSIFSSTGLPDEILCDQGTQFTADVMREVMRMLSISQLHSSPYHPQTNGVVERFNGTLKSMLKKLMADKPTDWDRYLPGALFAYREIPQASTGFAPFELLYGKVIKGPSQLLFQTWTGSDVDDAHLITSDYVRDLHDSLQDMVKRAQDAVQKESVRSRRLQQKKAVARSFTAGQKVLVLLPLEHSKLMLRWRGPFSVVKRVRQNDYLIQMESGTQKVFHVNLLREYVERNVTPLIAGAAVVAGDYAVPDQDVQKVVMETVPTVVTETVDHVVVDKKLSRSQLQDVHEIVSKRSEMFTDSPGHVDLEIHTVPMTTETVVNVRQYPLPFESETVLREEVDKMLKLGVVEPSKSPYASPVVLVKKPDKSTRVCLDFRALNRVTTFDAEPIPDPEVLFASLQGKKYFTKIDLSKGYWQIPMAPQDREKTAFRAPQGLMQFVRMPFGLSTAPSSFARMMRKLQLEDFDAVSFFDDILIASDSWESHMKSLDGVLERLNAHGLTVRPSKVSVGFSSIEFLGHIVGRGVMSPTPGKVSKILDIPVPKTKKQVRSLLGMVGFYRRYIPEFSALVAPLVELTKKNKPSKVVWSDRCQRAFDEVKRILSTRPVVQLPDFTKEFIVRSDASSEGIGAALMQQGDDGLLHPTLFASRKLMDREKRYSAIERECLALVWAVDKFHRYVFGRHFIVETDHRPLTYLSASKTTSARLQRWALALQEYSFTVTPIAGERNHEADVLSRFV
jgi:hypothetical protein